MATLDEIGAALQAADKVGNTADAKALAQAYQTAKAASLRTASVNPPSSMHAYLVDQYKKGVQDLAALPGMAVDLANVPFHMAERYLGLPTPAPFLGSEWIRGHTGALGIKDVQPPKDQYGKTSPGAEYFGTGARYLGAATAPVALTISTSEAPFTAALVEIAATLSSAEGSVTLGHVAKQLGEQFGVDPKTAQQIGQIVGSTIGPGIPIGLAKGLTKGTEFILNKLPFTREGRDAAQKALASAAVRKSIEAYPQASANLSESSALSKQIPGFQPTLGQASGAPGVLTIEEKMAQRSPEALSKMSSRQAQNEQEIKNFDAKSFQQSGVSPTAPAAARYRTLYRQKLAQLDALDKQISTLGARYEAQPNAAIGNRLRQLRDEAQTAAKAIRDQKYADVYATADAAGVKPDVSGIVQYVRAVKSEAGNKFQDLPESFLKVDRKWGGSPEQRTTITPERAGIRKPVYFRPTELAGKEKTVPFKELHSLYKEVNSELSAASLANTPEARHAQRYLLGLKKVLSDEIGKYEAPQYGSLATKLNDANSFQSKYAKTFYEGLGGRMERSGRYGEITPDEKIVSSLIFKPGQEHGLHDFYSIYGNGPEAQQLLKNGIYDTFYREAVRDGRISSTLAESFMRKYKLALDKLPAVKSELMNADKMNDVLLRRRAQIEQQRKILDRTVVAKIAGTEDPSQVVSKALESPSTMRALLSQAGKMEGGKEALAREIATQVQKQRDPYQYIVDNKETLKPALDALGPGHYDKLVAIAKAIGVLRRSEIPPSAVVQPIEDVGTRYTGTPFKSIFSQARAVAQGRQSRSYMVLDLVGKYLHKFGTEGAYQALEQAIYNPDVADDVLHMMSASKGNRKVVDDFAQHMMNHGIRLGAVQSGLIRDEDAQQNTSGKGNGNAPTQRR